jgi:small-conductance mechanosensitive channel
MAMKNKVLVPEITATLWTDSTAGAKSTSDDPATDAISNDAIEESVQLKEESDQMAAGPGTDVQLFQHKISRNQQRIQHLKTTLNRIQEEIRMDYQKNNKLKNKLAG